MQKQQSGKENVTAAEEFQIREQIWKNDLRDIILGKEYEALGMDVLATNFPTWLQAKNLRKCHPELHQPSDRQFNPLAGSLVHAKFRPV